MKSIFQNSADIRKVIAESLELSTDDRDRFDYTYPIYHTAFFYLLKRLGIPTNEKNKKWVVVDFDFICPINGQMVKINDTFDKKYHFYYLIPVKFLKTI